MVVRKVGKYEIGRTIGEGTFAKVKFAQNTETGESVAMKVLDRTAIIKHKMVDQIKREISIMKLVRHPHVVRLYEVLASRTKIYIILEFITGGELFDKIIHHGRLSEAEARNFFQQLIDGVDYCHSKGVFHRDLKPENLLLDSQGNIKISDFGLSAMPPEGVSILKTTCGTPNYVEFPWMIRLLLAKRRTQNPIGKHRKLGRLHMPLLRTLLRPPSPTLSHPGPARNPVGNSTAFLWYLWHYWDPRKELKMYLLILTNPRTHCSTTCHPLKIRLRSCTIKGAITGVGRRLKFGLGKLKASLSTFWSLPMGIQLVV